MRKSNLLFNAITKTANFVRSQYMTTSSGKNKDVLLVKRVVFNVVSLVSSVDGIKSSHMELK